MKMPQVHPDDVGDLSQAKLTAHTPGPWIIRDDDIYQKHTVIDGAALHLGRIAHVVFTRSARNPSECIANARLIAAAPELLERLRDALNALRIYGPRGSLTIKQGESAIAKAEGRE